MRRLVPLAAFVVAAALAAPASGQPKDPREQARALGEQGVALLNEGKYADALDALQRADALYHAPTLTFYMGECNKYLGRLVEARAAYEKVVADPLPPNASGPIRASHEKARAELAGLAKRIPWVAIELVPDDRAGASVSIDGNKVAVDKLGHIEVNPGAHHVEGTRGTAVARADVTVKEGEHRSLRLELPLPAVSSPVTPEPPVEPPPPGPPTHPYRGAGIVVASVGGVGILVGAITGAISLAKVGDIKDQCTDGHCPKSLKEDGQSATTMATVSDVGFIAGGVVAGVGIALVLWPGKKNAEASSTTGLRVLPGPGSLALHGRF